MTFVWLLTAVIAAIQTPSSTVGETLTREQAEARLSNCGVRRFESVAEFSVDGKMKRSRLTLCAADSETTEQWLTTLEKNEAIVAAQTRLPESARVKLLADLRAEIERVKAAQSIAIVGGGAQIAARPAPMINLPKSDFEVAALPPLPAPKRAGAASAPSTSMAHSATTARPALPPGRKPRLSIKCAVPGGAPIACDYFSLGDMFIVEAQENLASPLTLTFRRTKTGDVAEVPVRRLKQGEMASFSVPQAMCKGVVKTTFEVQIGGAGTAGLPYVDMLGPFKKAC